MPAIKWLGCKECLCDPSIIHKKLIGRLDICDTKMDLPSAKVLHEYGLLNCGRDCQTARQEFL